MEANPRVYLGIDKDWISILGLISYKFKIRGVLTLLDVVYLILRKVRLHESFTVVAHEFGISKRQASRYFSRYLHYVSSHLKELIFWPDTESIQKAMPIGFRKSFKNVVAIVDCLEITIEKPSNAYEQALTWSNYKKANTIKYYVAITPNGLFMFCSNGYGGRATDEMIVSLSGFLDNLQPGMEIMVDRGLKKIETMVLGRGARLVRPPNVSEGNQLSKNQVLTGRRIAYQCCTCYPTNP